MEGMLDSLACRLCRPLFGKGERPKCNHASRKFSIEIGLPSFAAKAEKKDPRLAELVKNRITRDSTSVR